MDMGFWLKKWKPKLTITFNWFKRFVKHGQLSQTQHWGGNWNLKFFQLAH